MVAVTYPLIWINEQVGTQRLYNICQTAPYLQGQECKNGHLQ